MKISGLLRRSGQLPGVTGVARVDRRVDALLGRVRPGDIAVLDRVDLDRRTANALVATGVAGVVNAAASISGRFPNEGPQRLVEAGIPLLDGVGAAALRIKDGARVRLHEAAVYSGNKEIARGSAQTAESIAALQAKAEAGLFTQLETFSADMIDFVRRERSLILEGSGVPEVKVPLRGRVVLVVAGGHDHTADLIALKRFIQEYRPVLIGVEAGAAALRAAGYRPQLIVGDPNHLDTATLTDAREVVVPAHPDGYAPGLERIQDLGIGAVTFPARCNPEDLALLLAEAHDAALVVTVGFQVTLPEFLDRDNPSSHPSTLLTQLRLGHKLINGRAVATLYRSRVSAGTALLLIASAFLAVVVALLVSDAGMTYFPLLGDTWADVMSWVKELS